MNSPWIWSSFLCFFLQGERESSLEGMWQYISTGLGICSSFPSSLGLLARLWYNYFLNLLVEWVVFPCGIPPVMFHSKASLIACCSFLLFILSSLKLCKYVWRLCMVFNILEFISTTSSVSCVGVFNFCSFNPPIANF